MSRILLTGATGYIGSVVAEKLDAAGHEVLGLARTDEAEERLTRLGHTPVRGDVADPEGVARLARAADGVIHAATTNDARNAQLDPAVTRATLRALEGTGKPFVYTSGVWGLGDTGDATADETSGGVPLPLVAFREPVERDVVASAARGVRGIVLRPAIAYGRGGGIPSMLVAEARAKGGVRVIGDGRQEWPTVHVEDLADLYVRAVVSAPGGSILHGADGQVAARDVALAASLAGGAGGRRLPWTLDEARAEYGGFGEFFALHQRVSSRLTRERLGWAPRAPSLLEELLVGSYATRA